MLVNLRNTISGKAEDGLRWLTASALRSTAIFVILTFLPIALLTYYIVAGSIRGSKADAAAADRQVRDFASSLLRTSFRSEREALAGAADEIPLERALDSAGNTTRRADLERTQAAASLARLGRRRREFAYIALYDNSGLLQAVAPEGADAPASLARSQDAGAASLPAWFHAAQAGKIAASPLQPGSAETGGLLELAVPVAQLDTSAGALVGALPASTVTDWLRHLSVATDRYLYVVDANRRMVSAPPQGPIAPGQIAASPALGAAVEAALGGQNGSAQFLTPIPLENHDITYASLPEANLALLVVRPVRFGFYLYRVFYDKLALIAMIIFLLAVATGLMLRAAFRYYQRYNREVERGRSKIEALLGSIGDGVFAVDAAGRIIEFNRAAADLTGLPTAATLGLPYAQVIELAEEHGGGVIGAAPDAVRMAMAQGRTLRFLRGLVLARRDHSRLPVTVTAAPVRDEAGAVQGCIVVFSDASQEREVDRMKNEFISIASHQLRTPMSAVKGVLALLLEQVLGPLNAEQRDYLRRAYDSNERLIALVNDLLNVSRLEQGSLQLRHEPVDLAELLRTLGAEFQPRAERYQQRLSVERVADGLDAVVLGDPVRLREVFANLVDNAIKYTAEGGDIRLQLEAARDEVVVTVSDSGVGIPSDKLASLFRKFSRIQNSLSGREFGTGLGLYFAHSVVELHQGRIEVDSRPGEGSRFRVVLPRQPRSPESAALADTLQAAS